MGSSLPPVLLRGHIHPGATTCLTAASHGSGSPLRPPLTSLTFTPAYASAWPLPPQTSSPCPQHHQPGAWHPAQGPSHRDSPSATLIALNPHTAPCSRCAASSPALPPPPTPWGLSNTDSGPATCRLQDEGKNPPEAPLRRETHARDGGCWDGCRWMAGED